MAFENSRNGIPEGTKFRSSCDACSAAKIKCTQERPECSHCAKRLRVCVYSLSKRVKRPRRPQMRHEGRGNQGSGTGQAVAPGDETIPGSAPLDSAGSSIDCMTSIDFLSSAASHPVTPRPSDWYDFFSHSDLTTTTNLFVEAASSTDWASLVATAEPFATLLDPALDFPASLPVPDPDHVQSVEKSNSDPLENINDTSIGSRGSLTNSPSRSCEVVSSETSSFPDINHPNNAKRAPPEGDSQQQSPTFHLRLEELVPGTNTSVPGCCCYFRVLRLLWHPFMAPFDNHSELESGGTSSQLSLTQTYNKMENMSIFLGRVVECPCSSNEDILVLLTFVLFRMQAWYAAAIDTTMRCHIDSNATNGTDPGLESVCKWTCAGDDGSESEDKSRMFIQDVLSRLTGLHMLTKRLSSRFDHIRRVKSVEGVAPTPPEGKKHNLPYSSALSQALISELRDRLTGLSQSTVERLRVW